jgi:hypothetical protein
MTINKNTLTAAINRLSKALAKCNELGLSLKEMTPRLLEVGDYVLHEGALKKVVAKDPNREGFVAFDGDTTIRQLPSEDCLVLRQ